MRVCSRLLRLGPGWAPGDLGSIELASIDLGTILPNDAFAGQLFGAQCICAQSHFALAESVLPPFDPPPSCDRVRPQSAAGWRLGRRRNQARRE
jgi:hypothetical protein